LVAQRSITTDLIYTLRTTPHATSRNPAGINALWGDTHVYFSTTKKAFGPKLWDAGDDHLSAQNPGDNPQKIRTIVSLLRPFCEVQDDDHAARVVLSLMRGTS